MLRSLLALLCLILLGAAAPAKDWRTNVVEDSGGWTFGRPGAPLLVEYGSLGCPTCARFAAASGHRLNAAVRAGRMRYSYRPFLIFPQDRAALVLARCAPTGQRLAFLKAALAAQPQTRAKLAEVDGHDGMRQRLFEAELAGQEAHAVALAALSGLADLGAAHGVDPAGFGTCLRGKAHHDWVTEADLTSRMAGVVGTPTFEWAGKRLPPGLTPEQLVALLPR